MPGSMALRTAIAAKLAALYGVTADPATEITVTSGATEAIFDAIQAVVRRDDEVIVFDPCYDSYEPSITLAGGRTVHLPLTGTDFTIDWERLRDALNERTRLVIVNSPHNPSGALLAAADFDRLAELLRPYDCYLLSDEVYEHVVFDGARHATALAQRGARAAVLCRVLVRQDLSRDGLEARLLRRAAGADLRAAPHPPVRNVRIDVAVAAGAGRVHDGASRASPGATGVLSGAARLFRALAGRDEVPRASFCRARIFNSRTTARSPGLPDVEFARWLTIEHGVATIPVSVFYRATARRAARTVSVSPRRTRRSMPPPSACGGSSGDLRSATSRSSGWRLASSQPGTRRTEETRPPRAPANRHRVRLRSPARPGSGRRRWARPSRCP